MVKYNCSMFLIQPVSICSHFSDHLSFSFSFFLHGESTVCASVGTMLHQPISRLTSDHLAIAQGSATGFQGWFHDLCYVTLLGLNLPLFGEGIEIFSSDLADCSCTHNPSIHSNNYNTRMLTFIGLNCWNENM